MKYQKIQVSAFIFIFLDNQLKSINSISGQVTNKAFSLNYDGNCSSLNYKYPIYFLNSFSPENYNIGYSNCINGYEDNSKNFN